MYIFTETSGISSQNSTVTEDECHTNISSTRLFNPRKSGKLRPISPYETALFDETLQEFIVRKEKRYIGGFSVLTVLLTDYCTISDFNKQISVTIF